ncbi:helix-turn-helix transcriptional regulator [Leptospira licerasiae]|uniref:helix-turn-helix domain-containing protein n=1 Tax=Leptospira licerasiae TaxID=447106 RepID=UPI003019B778
MKTQSFGRELRAIREAKKISLRSLADALGWSAAYLSDIELGNRNPPSSIQHIEKIANHLGIDPKPLVRLSTEKRDNKIELEIKNEKNLDLALVLARTWDNLGDDSMDQILKILDKYGEKSEERKGSNRRRKIPD